MNDNGVTKPVVGLVGCREGAQADHDEFWMRGRFGPKWDSPARAIVGVDMALDFCLYTHKSTKKTSTREERTFSYLNQVWIEQVTLYQNTKRPRGSIPIQSYLPIDLGVGFLSCVWGSQKPNPCNHSLTARTWLPLISMVPPARIRMASSLGFFISGIPSTALNSSRNTARSPLTRLMRVVTLVPFALYNV